MNASDWRKYDNEPLIDENNTFLLDFYFLAIFETNSGIEIYYCTINEGGTLMYYENEIHEFECAPWRVEDISYWMPFEYPDEL